MSVQGEIRVVEIHDPLRLDLKLEQGLSFFGPYLRHWMLETLQVGGEVLASKSSESVVNGLFLYDRVEKTGTIFTKSRDVFDYFYGLRPLDSVYAEINTGHPKETYDINTIDLEHSYLTHTFNYQVSLAQERDQRALEEFM